MEETIKEKLEEQDWIDNVEITQPNFQLSELAPQGLYLQFKRTDSYYEHDELLEHDLAVHKRDIGAKILEQKNKAMLETTAFITRPVGKKMTKITYMIRTIDVEVEEPATKKVVENPNSKIS